MSIACLRRCTLLAVAVLALPITCSQSGDGIYSGGVQPSPAGRVNPDDPGFANGGGTSRQ